LLHNRRSNAIIALLKQEVCRR